MAFSVLNNVAASNAQANLTTTGMGLNKALNRLSSGLRINNSGDDAAGLAVANAYRSNVAVLNQGIRNAGDGLSTLQIKDGALNNISNLIDRLSTLATQSASSSSTVGRAALDSEFQNVLLEITREATVAQLDSTSVAAAPKFSVFVSNDGTSGTIGGDVGAADATGLGIDALSVLLPGDAADAVAALKDAVVALGGVQAQVGTIENQLSYAINLGQSQVVNYTAAESRIRDANIAEEASNMSKFSILNQAGIAALAQANSTNSSVLGLLR